MYDKFMGFLFDWHNLDDDHHNEKKKWIVNIKRSSIKFLMKPKKGPNCINKKLSRIE